MIQTKEDLRLYLREDDRQAKYRHNWLKLLVALLRGQWGARKTYYLRVCRYREYYANNANRSLWHKLCAKYFAHEKKRLQNKYNLVLPDANVGYGTLLIHPNGGIMIGAKSIGKFCSFNCQTLCGKLDHSRDSWVTIGDYVYFAPGAKAFGNIRIGNDVTLAPNAVATINVPDHSVVTGFNQIRPKLPHEYRKFYRDQLNLTSEPAAQVPMELDQVLLDQVRAVLKETYPALPLDEDRLVEQRHIDSMTLMSIVSTLSEQFGVEIDYSQLTPANFNSVAQMTLLIQRLSGGNQVLDLQPERGRTSVVELILSQAKEQPGKLALVMEGEEVTYGRLGACIYTYYIYMRERGIQAGDYLLLQASCSVHYLAALYATQLIGAIAVPLEKEVGEERVKEIAADVRAKCILLTPEIEALSRLPMEEHVPFDTLTYPTLGQPALVLFTTGSTGKSKGVVVSHQSLSWAAYSSLKRNRIRKRTVCVTAFPLNHLAGLYLVTRFLTCGQTMVVFDGVKDIQRFFVTMEHYGVNYIGLAPSLLTMLVVVGKKKLREFSNRVYGIACGSEPLPLNTMRAFQEIFPNAQMQNTFGSSELGYVCTADCSPASPEVPLGTPLEGVTIGLRDEQGVIHTDNDCMGQICVKTPMLMMGYHNQPELSASVMQGEWFVMSDLAYRDASGMLYFRGRADDVIVVAGFKVSPLEVEGEAMKTGMLNECICVAQKDPQGMVSLRLIVVPLDAAAFDVAALKQHLTAHLEAYRVPRQIEVTDALQRTFNGKLDRKYYREKL